MRGNGPAGTVHCQTPPPRPPPACLCAPRQGARDCRLSTDARRHRTAPSHPETPSPRPLCTSSRPGAYPDAAGRGLEDTRPQETSGRTLALGLEATLRADVHARNQRARAERRRRGSSIPRRAGACSYLTARSLLSPRRRSCPTLAPASQGGSQGAAQLSSRVDEPGAVEAPAGVLRGRESEPR